MNINISLSDPNSIDRALEALERYKEKIERNKEKLSQKMAEAGAAEAKNVAMYFNAYDSGQLVDGIVAEQEKNDWRIHSTAPHSAFVEMGTGVRGEREPNPNKSYPGWEYDVNKHGDAGWWYTGDDGKSHWTKGMPSRPFMYDTAQIMKESVGYIAEKEWEK